jgi:PAS domain S-box-containing protein
MRFLFSYCHFFAALIYAVLGIIIIRKDFRSRLNQTSAAVFACFFLWSFSFVFIHHPDASKATAEIAEKIGSIGWISFTFFHLWFTWLYARRQPFRYFMPIAIVFMLVPVVLVYQQIVHSAIYKPEIHCDFGWLTLLNKSFWSYLYIVFYPVEAFMSFYILYDCNRKTENKVVKLQSFILLVSGFLTLMLGTLTNVVLPRIMAHPPVPIADIAALFWATGLAYVAIKYNMLDINPFVAAQRIAIAMKDLLFLLDTRGRIISVNPATLTTLACPEHMLIGKPFIDVIAKTDGERIAIAQKVVESSASTWETVFTIGSGPEIPVSFSASLIKGTGIVCVAHDISLQKQRTELLKQAKKQLEGEVTLAVEKLQNANERLVTEIAEKKQAAIALMETEERFRIIYEHAPDGIFLIDLQGCFLDANKEACRITGYTVNELKTFNAVTLGVMRGDERGNETGDNTRIGGAHSSESIEKYLVRKDGLSIPVEFNFHPIKIRERNLVLGVARDLTHRKKAEQEAEELKMELQQAQKMEAIGRLAGGIAHDFNNLLGGILGYAGLLEKKLEQKWPSEATIVLKIMDTVRQASQRTAQLLAFARKGKYQITPVNLHDVIDDVVGLLENTIDRKISLRRSFNAPCAVVIGDRSQLHSAILNLGVNARDALPRGGEISFTTDIVKIGKALALTYPYSITPGDFFKMEIADNGVGMDEKVRARVFEPFFSTKGEGKGTGLGLASVYGTVKHHNGFIEFWSEAGKGTVFTICLPLAEVAEEAEEKSVPASESFRQGQGQGRILVVDDVFVLREIATDVLSNAGYAVQSCADGAEALEWFRVYHDQCDLVILDLTMPKLSGKECFKVMKTIKSTLKVILTSGHAMDREINELLNDGAQNFLQKPFENKMLVETVYRVLHANGD